MRTFATCLLLAACLTSLNGCNFGSGTSESTGVHGIPLTRGKAVDPYIVSAVFQEVEEDGTVLQPRSSPSDTTGNFTFPRPLTPGAIIEMKVENRGFHNGVPYQGILRRRVDATASTTLVVSPLTTLLANGATADEVLSFLADSGLSGMTAADLTADPMAGLDQLLSGQVTDDRLRNLQAAMAANTLFDVLNDYRVGSVELRKPANRQLMRHLVEAAQEILSVQGFTALADALALERAVSDDLILGDIIRTAADCMHSLGNLADGGSMPTGVQIEKTVDEMMESAREKTRDYLQARLLQPES